MRHGARDAPPPLLPPSPPPSLNKSTTAASAASHPQKMLASIIMALFLPCAGMSVVFLIYICLLWYPTNNNRGGAPAGKPVSEKGFTASELEKLPRVTGKELVMGNECAVCLDEIEAEQAARVFPGCKHGFHLQCADTWLLKHSVCPLCRAELQPQQLIFNGSDDSPC